MRNSDLLSLFAKLYLLIAKEAQQKLITNSWEKIGNNRDQNESS